MDKDLHFSSRRATYTLAAFLIFAISLTLTVVSCRNERSAGEDSELKRTDTSASTQGGGEEEDMKERLPVLYMEKDSFELFFGKDKRATVQFFRKHRDSSLILAGWRGKLRNDEEYANEVIMFKTTDLPGSIMLKESNLVLGSQKIIKPTLRSISDSAGSLVIFLPKDTAIRGLNYIVYHIYVSDSLVPKWNRPNVYYYKTNPSPPASTSTMRLP